MRIGVIDSGMGGITFNNYLNTKLTNIDITLFIDHNGYPYGNKDLEWLKKRIIEIVNDLDCGVIIIACNTLSSIIYYYNLTFNKQVVDVITPTTYFFKENNYKNICILATKNTINMNIYNKLLNINIMYIDSTELIDDIELGKDYSKSLNKIVSNIPSEVDVILLGCTHLIAIKHIFREILNVPVISQDEIIINYLIKSFSS